VLANQRFRRPQPRQQLIVNRPGQQQEQRCNEEDHQETDPAESPRVGRPLRDVLDYTPAGAERSDGWYAKRIVPS
jgi:hypothetical protein